MPSSPLGVYKPLLYTKHAVAVISLLSIVLIKESPSETIFYVCSIMCCCYCYFFPPPQGDAFPELKKDPQMVSKPNNVLLFCTLDFAFLNSLVL